MAKKKKDELERTCDNCAYGPVSEECEDCEHLDQWFPKEPSCDGDSCKISVNGGPAVPFPSKEATEQVTGMVKEHVEKPRQLDLDMKPVEYPVDVAVEDCRVLTFECGSWTLKVREDRLEGAAACCNITALVQRRLKAASELYPLSEGEFDRWVQRFTRSLTNYVRTGCA
jgi:hypothetical protein